MPHLWQSLHDPLLLARIQFAFTMSFHILFPAFTIGLASWLVVLEALWLKTNQSLYRELYLFWSKIFSVAFGMGVVSGIVMSYQFGTNWSAFSHYLGNVLGPLLSYEVLTAFFLEASFLSVMLFGWQKVGPKLHFTATCGVAFGTLVSAFWILSANSWMQTPSGYWVDAAGIVQPQDWWAIVFNPSFPYRFCHMITAAFLTTAFAVSGVAAFYLLKGRFKKHAKVMLRMGLGLAVVLSPLQAFIGDLHGLNTLKYQPCKVAAIEGAWATEQGAPLRLWAWPDELSETNRYELKIPKLGSLILTHSVDGLVPGLKSCHKHLRPPVKPVFIAFRVMVGIGCLMILTITWALVLFWRKSLYHNRVFLSMSVLMGPSGFLAILMGWFVTEIGRQPYLAYHLLETKKSLSPIAAPQVLTSLIMLMSVYCFLFGAGTYYIIRLIQLGPKRLGPTAYGQHSAKDIF